ncbi:MAG TPA: cellulose synthase operon protein YhjQ/BcsQ [Stellaceae bacterium]|nr:cellulose synthase operon protein YhjQ/BcsQ [Stellaceae bacterium]
MADAAEAQHQEGSRPIALLACVADEVTRETVSRVVSHLGPLQAKVRPGDLTAARKALDPSAPPQLMLIDISGNADPVPALAELIQLCPRSTRVLVIGSVNDVSLYRALTNLGVVDYLVKPISGEMLHDALAAAIETGGPEGGGRKTRSTAFLGARGGIGTTTMVAAVGWYFVNEFHQRAAVIDLDLHFGTLALSVDLEPGRGLREALEHPERIDTLLLASAMSGGERFKVLASEESLDESLRVDAGAIEPLFQALSQDFDQLVVDLPRALDDGSRHLLGVVDQLILVTDLSLAGLRDTLRLVDLGKRIGCRANPMVIASQVGAAHRGEITQREFERGLGQDLDHIVTFDAKVGIAMARHGKALPEVARASKPAEELLALAQRISGRETVGKKRSLLGKLWK